jgi:hypothetical protein
VPQTCHMVRASGSLVAQLLPHRWAALRFSHRRADQSGERITQDLVSSIAGGEAECVGPAADFALPEPCVEVFAPSPAPGGQMLVFESCRACRRPRIIRR